MARKPQLSVRYEERAIWLCRLWQKSTPRSWGTLPFRPAPLMASTTAGLLLDQSRWTLPLNEKGIGKALISTGLKALRDRGAAGCALIGNPDIYRGSGFESDGLLTHVDLDSRFVQRVVFSGPPPRGELRFAAAFEAGIH